MGTGGDEDPRPGLPAWPVSVVVDPGDFDCNRLIPRHVAITRPAADFDFDTAKSIGLRTCNRVTLNRRLSEIRELSRLLFKFEEYLIAPNGDQGSGKVRARNYPRSKWNAMPIPVRRKCDFFSRSDFVSIPWRGIKEVITRADCEKLSTDVFPHLFAHHCPAFSDCSFFFASYHAVERLCCIDWFRAKPIAVRLSN